MLTTIFTAASLLLAPVSRAQEPAPDPTTLYALGPVLQPLTEDRIFRESVVGLQVVNTRTGEEVFAFGGDQAMVPASVMKMLTTAAALRQLGPSYTFSTEILRDGDISPEGVLDGNLYIKGYGDPTLVVEKLWRLVLDLQVAGITEITGNVIFDDTWFDDGYLITGWEKDVDIANGPAYFAPIGALSVNYNTTALVVAPGAEVGQPARVTLETPVSVVTIENEMVTGRSGSRQWVRIDRELDESEENVTFKFSGSIPIDGDVDRHYRAVGKPLPHFIAMFHSLVDERGIKVKGKYLPGATPPDASRVTRMESPRLATIVGEMNKHSSNFMAEMLLRTLGAQVKGAPGSTATGVEVVNAYLDGLGLPEGSYKVANGSGLSRETSVQPSVITAVLLDMVHDRKVGPEFLSSLAIGGVDGTLWARFRAEDEVGRIRGKTGSLNGVFCLAGVVDAGDGDLYAFAFLVNELRTSSWPVRRLQERFADAMFAIGADATVAEGPNDTKGTR